MIKLTEIGYNFTAEKNYIYGTDHGENGVNKITHLYEVLADNDYLPMCKRGWNRGEHGYSIFRGNLSNKGVCKLCYRRAKKGLSGLEFKK